MKVLFAGSPEVAVPSLKALLDAEHDVVAVATKPDAPTGRGRTLAPSDVALAAAALGIPTLKPGRASESAFADTVRALAVDVAVVVAWGALVPGHLLTLPRHGWVNAHFSLLPAYRGAAPVQRALIDGQSRTGVTTFRLVSALDAGPIFRQHPIEIEPDETAGELLERLSHLAARELVATLSAITAGFDPVPQPTDGITLAPKLTVDEVCLDWSAPRHAICGLVRGANPNPGAWTLFRGERLKILRATSPLEAVPGAAAAAPGTLINTKRELLVTCGESSVLRLDQVQPVGKKPMTGADWARGIRIQAGERFG